MQNRLTLVVGLPRSGKSTWIKNNVKDDVVISPDRIRKLIFGHQFHKEAEDFVWAYAKGMAKLILEQGKNVLIDATNLTHFTRDQWYKIAIDYKAKIRIIWIKTSLKKCKIRNKKSPKGERLPKDVIDKMAIIFENPTGDFAVEEDFEMSPVDIIEIPYKQEYKNRIGNIYQEEVVSKKDAKNGR